MNTGSLTARRSSQAIIPEIIERHIDDAAFLSRLRRRAVQAPSWSLVDLVDLDERLEAHIDGVRVAGDRGWTMCEQAIEQGPGELFVAATLAIESRDRARLSRVLGEVPTSPGAMVAVADAFERVAPHFLQGTIRDLLNAVSPVGRHLGLSACVSHGVNPGPILDQMIDDADEHVSVRAVRACGELGLLAKQAALVRERDLKNRNLGIWMVWATVILGQRGSALDALTRMGLEVGSNRAEAFRLALQAMDVSTAHRTLQGFGGRPERLSWLLGASGIVGDPAYASWLIGNMSKEKTARRAADSFCLMTGADLVALRLDRPRPAHFESGPNDDPDDPNVAMDPDEGLPWPDPERVKDWWSKNSSRFQPGTRYFMGAPVTREHCIDVLKNGYQRQRILAAHYLCLLNPGTPLFNTGAPAWRQQRLLAEMK